MDSSKAILPGAEIMIRSDSTGIEQRTTVNNAGVYNFQNLQPGVYTVTAEAPGFQRAIRTDVRVNVGSQINLPIELAVAGSVTEVEVTSTVDHMILEAGSSTGTVLQEDTLIQLPLVANDAMEMINLMGGVVKSEDQAFYGDAQTFAGVTGNNINIMRDGISVNEVRYISGITSPGRINPETVGEFKMVLSPVDAEMGRGAGQVQTTTRSGSNRFSGSIVWNIQNSALDAMDYNTKHVLPDLVVKDDWRNVHNYTISVGGPIIRNRTFFFVTWDQTSTVTKTSIAATVLTNCARKGIYRWLSDTRNGNAGAIPSINTNNDSYRPGQAPYRPVVDYQGNPLDGSKYTFPVDTSLGNWSGTTPTTQLNFQSVLGTLSSTARDQLAADPVNCTQYLGSYGPQDAIGINTDFGVTGTWDKYRTGFDQSGLISRFSSKMPQANDWQVGDGLNTAAHRWTRRGLGAASIFGLSMFDENRKAITMKIDHNISAMHRLSGTLSMERSYGDTAETAWPEESGGSPGMIDRKPKTFTIALMSTLSPTLLNEARFGMQRSHSMTYEPLSNPDLGSQLAQTYMDLYPTSSFTRYNNQPILAGPGANAGSLSMLFHPEGTNSQPLGSRSNNIQTTWGGVDHRWTAADNLTWIKGAHALKGGVEYRFQTTDQLNNGYISFGNGANTYPSIKGGVNQTLSGNTTLALSDQSLWPNMPLSDVDYRRAGENATYSSAVSASGNYSGVYNLLTYMAGSVTNISQYFYAAGNAANPRWNDPGQGETIRSVDMRNHEVAFFFKDDWRFTSSLNLNLGVRYEYYGVPWEKTGMAHNVLEGWKGIMGMSGGDLSTWMPMRDQVVDTGYRTRQGYVGPNSPNPDESVHGKDFNNFAPHVGFSWQLPWFGRNATTLRAGYSISYLKVANYDTTMGYASTMAAGPNLTNAYIYTGHDGCIGQPAGTCYLSFQNIAENNDELLPLYDQRTQEYYGISSDLQPKIMSLQSETRRANTLNVYDPDVRNPYVQNLNMSITRQVGRNLTVDVRYIGTLGRKILTSTGSGTGTYLNINTINLINSGMLDELKIVRAGGESDVINAMIKPGTYVAGNTSGSQQLRTGGTGANLATGNFSTVVSTIANANFGTNAAGCTNLTNPSNPSLCYNEPGTSGNVLRESGTPENLLMTNPQYSGVSIRRNSGHTNYHSLQTQVTLRPTNGLNFQATYTWSRNLARGSVVDYRDWNLNYALAGQHRSHTLNVNGAWTLPLGPGGSILRNSTGVLKKTVEGWQLGWIATATSGVPMSLSGITTVWGGWLDQVGQFDTKQGKVEWDDELGYGFFFGNGQYDRVIDPMCMDTNVVAVSLRSNCINNTRALVEVDESKGVAGYKIYNAGTQDLSNPVNGTIIFQNSEPGRMGNVMPNTLTSPGRWNIDMNMGKSFEFMEGKRIEIRLDAQNIFNHATPSHSTPGSSTGGGSARQNSISSPFLTVNSTSSTVFGRINSKTGHRTFQGRIRLSF